MSVGNSLPRMTNNSSDSRHIVLYAVFIPLTGVSTIACVIALGVLLYYKMWQRFIYRLVLYMFVSLAWLSLSTISSLSYDLIAALERKPGKVNFINNTIGIVVGIITISVDSSLAVTFMLVTCIAICIYLMALHNYTSSLINLTFACLSLPFFIH